MCYWLENYADGLHSAVMTCSDNEVMGRAASLEYEVRNAHRSLQDLLQQGQGDGRPAVGVIVGFVNDQIGVFTSHSLNVAIWGTDGACEMERHAVSEARTALHMLSQLDPEWAREREEIFEKHRW